MPDLWPRLARDLGDRNGLSIWNRRRDSRWARWISAVQHQAMQVDVQEEPSATRVFWTTAAMALGGGVLSVPQQVDILPVHWPLLAGLAVSGFLGQLAITEAFRHGQASAVAPFEYTALAWAVMLDWVFWHSVPDAYTLAGGAIIIASGIYLIRREAPREMVVVPP